MRPLTNIVRGFRPADNNDWVAIKVGDNVRWDDQPGRIFGLPGEGVPITSTVFGGEGRVLAIAQGDYPGDGGLLEGPKRSYIVRSHEFSTPYPDRMLIGLSMSAPPLPTKPSPPPTRCARSSSNDAANINLGTEGADARPADHLDSRVPAPPHG